MRFRSKSVDGFQVFAVSGTNTISFAIDATKAAKEGLLGFAVERADPVEKERFFVFGFKVFPSVIPEPDDKTSVKTFDQPIQSFVWDDFTAKPDRAYEYIFHPLRGTPKNLDRSAATVSIKVKTEPLFSKLEHDVFFNRGVASSQAYSRKFGNVRPDKLKPPEKAAEARQWLSRDLDDAIIAFIKAAKKGDGLACCFYEFRYAPVVQELKAAVTRGVDVKIIIDAKKNAQSFPRKDNLALIKKLKIPAARVIKREARKSAIQHNKFMVLLEGKKRKPTEVWTGSTNISDGGIHGQTNVGHWVRNPEVAVNFKAYWDLLSGDPGGKDRDAAATVKKKNAELRDAVAGILEAPTAFKDVPKGVTAIFSPRSGPEVLAMYAAMVDDAEDLACITLAFGISKVFKDALVDHTKDSHISFFLLEKEDKANAKAKNPFVQLNAGNNVYEAFGAFIDEPLYQWTKETNAQFLKLNTHVSYIHSKFLLMDPLGEDPIVVTGSANFSDASTNENDENMLAIRGDQRVADIYLTEFNRLFYHYYFRSVQQTTKRVLSDAQKKKSDAQTLFLAETDVWTKAYKPGSLKQKRVDIFTRMKGFEAG